MALHHRNALLGENEPMIHALSGGAAGATRKQQWRVLFKPKTDHSQVEESARIIQAKFRHSHWHTLYDNAQDQLVRSKLLYQRVEPVDGAAVPSEQLQLRTVVRAKEAYAQPFDVQLERFEAAMHKAHDVQQEREVEAYQKWKAARAAKALAPQAKAVVATSQLHYYAIRIQRMVRSYAQRQRHALVADAALDTLAASKRLYQRRGPPLAGAGGVGWGGGGRGGGSPPPRAHHRVHHDHAPEGSRSPRPMNAMAKVRLEPDERVAVVVDAIDSVSVDEAVRKYEAERRARALLRYGPRAVPKRKTSEIAHAALKIQWLVRHFLATRRGMRAPAVQPASPKLYRAASMRQGVAPGGQRGQKRIGDAKSHASAPALLRAPPPPAPPPRPPAPLPRAPPSMDVALEAPSVEEAAWVDEHAEALEHSLSDLVQALAEARPDEPLQFLGSLLRSGLPAIPEERPPSDPQAEAAWMETHGPTLERLMSFFVDAAARERPSHEPLALLPMVQREMASQSPGLLR